MNLFVASELQARDQRIRLRQDTRFPEEPGTKVTIVSTPTAPWTLRIRIPAWCRAAVVKVNGRAVDGTPGAGAYFALTRTWKAGDRVELALPMELAAEPLPDAADVRAIRCGPVVLAGDLGTDGLTDDVVRDQQAPETSKAPMAIPALRPEGRRLEDWIRPDGTAALAFRAATTNGSIRLRPLNAQWGRFAVYWNVT